MRIAVGGSSCHPCELLVLSIGDATARFHERYRQLRNRKMNEALVQGVETACAVLTTTPQGQPADAQFVKWLME